MSQKCKLSKLNKQIYSSINSSIEHKSVFKNRGKTKDSFAYQFVDLKQIHTHKKICLLLPNISVQLLCVDERGLSCLATDHMLALVHEQVYEMLFLPHSHLKLQRLC